MTYAISDIFRAPLRAALAAALALLLSGQPVAAADYIPPCVSTPTAYPKPVAARVDLYPVQVAGGTCGPYIVGTSAAGIVFGYWCQAAPDKTPSAKVWAVRWSSLTPAMMADFLAIKLASDPGEAARLHQAKYLTLSVWNMPDVICEPATDWRVRFNAAQPVVQAPPPPAAWRTPAVGSGTLYLAAGTRLGSIIPGKKAPPNAPCACPATPITYYGGTYCPLAAAPVVASEVTLCRRT